MLSVIYTNANECHKEYCSIKALQDSGISSFFDESVCNILVKDVSVSCIEKRNEFFNAMSEGGFLRFIENFEKKLSCSLKEYSAYTNSSCKTEEFFAFFQYVQAYSEMLDTAVEKHETAFWENIFIWAKKQKSTLESVADRIARYREILLQISNLSIKLYNGQLYLSKKHSYNTLYNKLEKIFTSVGYGLKTPGELHIRLSKKFSDAFCDLFSSETAELSELMCEIKECMSTEYFNLKSELDFYFSIYCFFSKISKNSMPVCFASIADTPLYRANNIWDPSLFNRVENIVDNDIFFGLDGNFYLLTGANGGGKTTFARSVISNLIFFKSGCPVLASSAVIYPFCSLYTFFPKESTNEGSRFENELKEINQTIEKMSPFSFIVLNESFSTTNADVAKEISLETVKKLNEKEAFGLFVTHFHELTDKIPSLGVVVKETSGNKRTFKVVKTQNSKSSFTEDILKKYKMDRIGLLERKAEHALK